MTYRDLPYYEDIKTKTCLEYKFHKNKHENHANPLHTHRQIVLKCVITYAKVLMVTARVTVYERFVWGSIVAALKCSIA